MSGARRAVITGVRGQDGWYLAQRLLELGYSVVGTTHDPMAPPALAVGAESVRLVHVDLTCVASIEKLVSEEELDEFYNLAARASSSQLFDDPLATAEINGMAVARLLEIIRKHRPSTRFCQASSSEVFAGSNRTPQPEDTPRAPLNAYGAAKAFADHLVLAYRTTHNLFACSAILFPHESPRRPAHFLVRKVAAAAARIRRGSTEPLLIGDLEAVRDWGYAPDYVEAMRRMLQLDIPQDFVIATGIGRTVREVCEIAFGCVGLDWREHVRADARFTRAPEATRRIGDATSAAVTLGWRPSLDFEQMVMQMVETELSPRAEP